MERRRTAREVRFADDVRLSGRVDDYEVVRRHGPEADRIGWIRLVRPAPSGVRTALFSRSVHQALFRQKTEDLLNVDTTERFVARKRQLERRTLHVIDEYVQVVGIDQRALGRSLEEVARIPDNELIEGSAARDHHGGRSTGAPAGAPRALPRRRDRARVTGHHRNIERTDVDAKLERVGRHDRANETLTKALLDLSPPQRQIPAAIPTNSLGRARHVLEVVLQVRRQDLGREPALGKYDELEIPLEKLGGDPARFAEVRPADAELMVDDRRIDEHEELLTPGRTGLLHDLKSLLCQPLSELARIGDRRRRADERRRGPVVPADSPQPPQHVAEMTAEDATI